MVCAFLMPTYPKLLSNCGTLIHSFWERETLQNNVLGYATFPIPFIVETDASARGLSFLLSQNQNISANAFSRMIVDGTCMGILMSILMDPIFSQKSNSHSFDDIYQSYGRNTCRKCSNLLQFWLKDMQMKARVINKCVRIVESKTFLKSSILRKLSNTSVIDTVKTHGFHSRCYFQKRF